MILMNVLIVGANKLAYDYIRIIANFPTMKIIAIIDAGKQSVVDELAKSLQIKQDDKVEKWLDEKLDYIIETNDDEKVIKYINEHKQEKTILIQASILRTIKPLLIERNIQFNNLELILNNIRDGLIVVNNEEIVQFMNKAASEITGVNKDSATGEHIKHIVKNTRLPKVLQNQKKEVNQKLTLENGKQIITTRIPLINDKHHLIGAFAIFKDSNEVISLAEENTDLKEIKTMLEAIIHSSDEAISVVDEDGNGLIINPAYTRITGLTEKEVIGKPATVDISEGESMHLQVLQTRRPVRGAKMKVGPFKKEVIVNVAPIIVAGKLKGSVAVIHDISEIQQLTTELKRAKQIIRNLEATYTFDDIIGTSSEMMIAIEQAKIGAKTPATVLLRGASGTGKELFAHAIHNESDRKHNKFIRVNCAAIAESVLESELFGYEEGAFTGAKAGGKKGLFEEANLGSIFLDEIGELSLAMQAKLLRVLQEKEVVRVGGTTPIPLDIRVITATNVNLEKAITNKTFREDLYYRLNRLPIYIPSLQERMNDLPSLVYHMIAKVNQLYGRNITSISTTALEKLRQYHWPGNIRELENVIGRAAIFMDVTEEEIHFKHLPDLQLKREKAEANLRQTTTNRTLQDAMDQYEREYIAHVYKENDHNKTATAKQLNISVRNLYYKIEKYGLDR
ncbi:sigma-54-dependent transcriptional regulator [Pseudogracilibacillus auburnensis]|nr:sigma-54-dependent Fis family transcriptional regulator [Pseudogracilibacillus auburnensis]MBO1004316.1 sigma-54-dependent transcriptional regulator [Pseudogracilibacillus auburnensis]